MTAATARFYPAGDWTGTTACTFALVIGASRYPALAPRPGFARQETYGLSELSVSALTAFRFANWLQPPTRLPGSPAVRCWLLASPTAAEIEAEPALADAQDATFDNCAAAIREWDAAARALSAAQASASRLVFFYSGHGLERVLDEQLLLPSDYLEDGLVNRAINVRDLRQALASCGVAEQLFLLDACRNDHTRLRELGLSLTGTQVLNPVGSFKAHPDLDSPVFYGTATGQQAFGPRSVAQGLTLFGQALLSGVSMPPADMLDRRSDRCRVVTHGLQEYMNARIAQLLKDYGSKQKQRVFVGGQSAGAMVICEVPCDSASAEQVPSVRDSESYEQTSVPLVDPTTGDFIGSTSGEDPFGDEAMSRFWSTGELHRPGDPGHQPVLTLVRVDRRGTADYDIAVRIDSDPGTNVLTFGPADGTDRRFACRLPWLGFGALQALHVTCDSAGVVGVQADLDLANRGLLGRTAAAWRAYQDASATAAARHLPDDALRPVIDGAAPTPLPLVVATLLRPRAGLFVHPEWLEQASIIYQSWPDPAVLLAEWARAAEEPTEVFVPAELPDDLPLTAEVMTMAWRQLSSSPGGRTDRPEQLEVLESIVARMEPGSLFPVVVGLGSVDRNECLGGSG